MPPIAKLFLALLTTLAVVAVLATPSCAPTGPDTLTRQAAREIQQGELDQAQAHLQRALAFEPSNPEALLYMGKVSQAQGKLEMALYYYQSAIAAEPGNKQALAGMTQVQEQLGQTGQNLRIVPSPNDAK